MTDNPLLDLWLKHFGEDVDFDDRKHYYNLAALALREFLRVRTGQ